VEKILLVEDEKSIGEIVKFNLESENYYVVWVQDGKSALKQFDEERFDLIVLDVMLPELNGFDVYESIRLKNLDIAILFLTARDDQKDKLKGLSLGADDYITKPFDLNEFLLRVKNILNRSKKTNQINHDIISFGKNVFNYKTMVASNGNDELQLSTKEAKILKVLFDHKNEVVSRDSLLEKVWGYDVYPTTRTVDNFIVKLRKFFEEDQKKPKYIHSIRGIGYKLIV
jgi:two-component system, OmpR family, alkaline phosphatase synthesis response regulator PhoP